MPLTAYLVVRKALRPSFCHPGGGGYGDPLERDAESVERDVINGYVSLEKAREDYSVVIDSMTLRVDLKATQQLRDLDRRPK